MPGGVEPGLATAVASRQGEQHGPAAVGWQLDATEGEHELQSQRGSGPSEAHGDGAAADVLPRRPAWRGRCRRLRDGAAGHGRRLDAVEGDGEGVGLFAFEGELFGTVEAGVVDEAVGVAALHRLTAGVAT